MENKSIENLSDIVVHMKYAKYSESLQRRETWSEIVDRNKAMHIKKFPNLVDSIEHAYRYVYDKKILPSMRSMQFAGKPIELSPNRIYNCSYLPIEDVNCFSETMFLLLSGCGVGFSVQKHHIEKLPFISKPHVDANGNYKKRRFLISDSIEGWADSIKQLMKAFLDPKVNALPDFDFNDIRHKGAKLITSGGKAPGADPLKKCLFNIQLILESKQHGDRLTTLEVHDIVCHIADAVLAGGIRRAALISFFSFDDLDMINCKYGNWRETNPQRGRSNNSAVILRSLISEAEFNQFWEKIKNSGSGEPGIYFTNDRDVLSNPCCLSGDTLIQTEHDFITIKELVEMAEAGEQLPKLYTYNETTKHIELDEIVTGKLMRKNAEIIKLELEDGNLIKLTSDHKVFTTNRGWIEAMRLTKEDEITISPNLKLQISTEGLSRSEAKQTLAKLIQGYNENFDFNSKTGEILFKGKPLENFSKEYWFPANNDKTELLNMVGCSTAKLKSITIEKNEDVYDLEMANNHNFFANNILVHNCEISLKPYQFCNLCEINVSDLETQEEFNERAKAATIIGTLQAAYTDFHYLRPIWKKTTEKEALIGIGLTGIGSGKVLNLDMKQAAKIVKDVNKQFAKILGINKAARTTTIKPSGSAATVLGCSSGIHAWHDPYYIRRVRVNKNESIYNYLYYNHPELVKDEYFNPTHTAVIEVPIKAPEGSIYRHESPIELLERVKRVKKDRINEGHVSGINTHNVSVTVSIKDEEWQTVGEWMWNNRDYYNGISVLPYDGGSYIQAPFESITEEQYLELEKHICDIDLTQVVELEDYTDLSGELACSAGGCEII